VIHGAGWAVRGDVESWELHEESLFPSAVSICPLNTMPGSGSVLIFQSGSGKQAWTTLG